MEMWCNVFITHFHFTNVKTTEAAITGLQFNFELAKTLSDFSRSLSFFDIPCLYIRFPTYMSG